MRSPRQTLGVFFSGNDVLDIWGGGSEAFLLGTCPAG